MNWGNIWLLMTLMHFNFSLLFVNSIHNTGFFIVLRFVQFSIKVVFVHLNIFIMRMHNEIFFYFLFSGWKWVIKLICMVCLNNVCTLALITHMNNVAVYFFLLSDNFSNIFSNSVSFSFWNIKMLFSLLCYLYSEEIKLFSCYIILIWLMCASALFHRWGAWTEIFIDRNSFIWESFISLKKCSYCAKYCEKTNTIWIRRIFYIKM